MIEPKEPPLLRDFLRLLMEYLPNEKICEWEKRNSARPVRKNCKKEDASAILSAFFVACKKIVIYICVCFNI